MSKPLKSKTRRKPLSQTLSVRFLGGLRHTLFGALPYLVSFVIVGTLLGGVAAYAVNSPTFQLAEVRILNAGTMTGEQSFRFCELQKGENVVTLDLLGVQEVIKRRHPEFKEVAVRRVLPNRIEVRLKRRTPVAQVAFSKFVQVDGDLVILPGSSPAAFRNLTTIEGTPMPKEGLYVGTVITDPATRKALKLAEAIKRSNILRNHALTKIDIADPKNIVFAIDSAVEVRIGDSHIVERLKILDQTLRTIDFDPSKISYIDLRFDDVVIGPR